MRDKLPQRTLDSVLVTPLPARKSFFAAIPAGADAYVLRHIVHDWLDPDAVAILRKCRDAMMPESKLLLVEMIIPPGNEPSFGKWLDLMMLLVAGRERTEEEYSRLLSEAGLRLTRVIPTQSDTASSKECENYNLIPERGMTPPSLEDTGYQPDAASRRRICSI